MYHCWWDGREHFGWNDVNPRGVPLPNEDGIYTLKVETADDTYTGNDHYGNDQIKSFGPYKIDRTAPLVSDLVATGYGPVNISATASDNLSGVAKMEVYAQGQLISTVNATTVATAWTPPSGLASALIEVYATDVAGNRSAVVSKNVDLDPNPPVVTISFVTKADGKNGWFVKKPPKVQMSASAASGIAQLKIRTGTGAFVDYTAPITVDKLGTSTVEAYAVSKAGRQSDPVQLEVRYDPTSPPKPVITDDGDAVPSADRLGLTLSQGDPESGIDSLFYSIGDATNPTKYAKEVKMTVTGLTQVSLTLENLSLPTGLSLYFYAHTTNGAGRTSDPGRSDGIRIDPEAFPVALRGATLGAAATRTLRTAPPWAKSEACS